MNRSKGLFAATLLCVFGQAQAPPSARAVTLVEPAKGWVDYKYPNPATNLLEQKTSYFGFHGSMLIGCGIDKEAH